MKGLVALPSLIHKVNFNFLILGTGVFTVCFAGSASQSFCVVLIIFVYKLTFLQSQILIFPDVFKFCVEIAEFTFFFFAVKTRSSVL